MTISQRASQRRGKRVRDIAEEDISGSENSSSDNSYRSNTIIVRAANIVVAAAARPPRVRKSRKVVK